MNYEKSNLINLLRYYSIDLMENYRTKNLEVID
jgi:hypothetical protein